MTLLRKKFVSLVGIFLLLPMMVSAQYWGGDEPDPGDDPSYGYSYSSITTEFPAVNNGIVEFRAQYTAEPLHDASGDDVLTWFRFGLDPSNLAYSSEQKRGEIGTHMATQGATRFQANTVYYVEAFMKFEGYEYSGGVVDFNTGDITFPAQGSSSVSSDFAAGYNSVNLTPSDTVSPSKTLFGSSSTSQNTVSGNKKWPSLNIFDFFKRFRLPTRAERDAKRQEKQSQAEAEQQEQIAQRTTNSVSEFSNSATNDDEEGEIVRVAPYTPGVAASTEGSLGTGLGVNYLFLILVILMLFGIVVLFYIITRKKNRMKYGNPYQPQNNFPPYEYPPYDDPRRGPPPYQF